MTDSSPLMLKDEVQRNHPVIDLIRKRAEAAGLFPSLRSMSSAGAGPRSMNGRPTGRRVEVERWMADPTAWAQRSRA